MVSRLEGLWPDVAAEVQVLDSTAGSRLGRLAADFAVGAAGSRDSNFRDVVEDFRAGTVDDQATRWLASFVEQLDQTAWDLQERVDASDAERDDYIRAFGMARAASALSYAIAGDVAEAIYEASATVDDPRPLLALIEESLDDEGDR